MRIHAAAALLPDGWAQDVTISVAGDAIAAVTIGTAPQPDDLRVSALIAGMLNLHSHAFQRGFSGLTEYRGQAQDSFWTWREMMYHFALRLDPDEMQAIAELAYVEMLEAGYTRVGEFHYLHHAPDGRPYATPSELSQRIFAAAENTGIALTHLPVFYAHGGFGGAAANDGQRRFLHGIDAFDRLMQDCAERLRRPQDRLGLAPHSLRAATAEHIAQLSATWRGRPLHIHIAEQLKEVKDSIVHFGARPVEWLLDHCDVGPDWCLIHATHLTQAEVEGIAQSGAVVGLCPVTEANLGDGVFPAAAYLQQGGSFGVGTDSNVAISVAQELQMLEYSQRLTLQGRNICTNAGPTAEALFLRAAKGGAQALGAELPQIATGALADLVALHDPLDLAHPQSLLNRWVFGTGIRVSQVWAAGTHLVQDGRHRDHARVKAQASRVLRRLIGEG